MGDTFADYMKNDLKFTDQDLASLGFYQTNSEGNGYGFLGYTAPSQDPGWWGKGGYLDTGLGIGQLALGGLNAFTGLQQLDLGRKQFGFAKDAFNAQLGNSIQNYRNAAANARRVAFAAQGANAPSVFGTTSQDAAGNQYANDVSKNMVTKV